jgi:protoporphyrin/coproporphyrin ferrochelatase
VSDSYDALLVVSFGGPERREDVLPFLENVLRGRNVPRARMLEVAEHYYHFDGVSPINQQTRELIAALQHELSAHGVQLPIYWGNRNWHPLLTDTVREMTQQRIRRVLAYVTSAYSSYSGCRQYLENIEAARQVVGAQAPVVDKLRVFFNHPGFIEAQAARTRQALDQVPAERRDAAQLLYTAHSIPLAMSQTCRYVEQLTETCRLITERLGHPRSGLVYQSRSGPPHQPWLEPDICDAIRQLHEAGPLTDLVIVPVGFLSDHLEVLYDLDVQAKALCDTLGVHMVRAATVGTHPRFVQMIRELVVERIRPAAARLALGRWGPSHDVCPVDCCRGR